MDLAKVGGDAFDRFSGTKRHRWSAAVRCVVQAMRPRLTLGAWTMERMNRRGALKSIGAAASGVLAKPDHLGGAELAPRPAGLVAVSRAVSPDEEWDVAESAVDRIFRFLNRQSDALLFREMMEDLESAIVHEATRLKGPHPERPDARRSHGRLVAALAQMQLQLGQVHRGLETLSLLNGATRRADLASRIAGLERVIGPRTADDVMTTYARLREKGRAPSEFRRDETARHLADAEGVLETSRNRSKLYWRRYLSLALAGRGPDRARYEDGYSEMTPGGVTPEMIEASLKGTLIYELCLADEPEAALQVSRRTRALIMPLWNGLALLPRMTSHMILCHFYLILNAAAQAASLRRATSIQEECEGQIMALRCDMEDLGITEKADGFWEAEAVFAAMPRRRPTKCSWPEALFFQDPRQVVTHYHEVVERLTRDCEGMPSARGRSTPLPSVFTGDTP